MRNISPAALAQIQEREGTEPITLVQIFWDSDQSVIYGDRAFTPGIQGQLLDVGEINNVINASEGSNSGSVSIRLEDKDGILKSIFDTMDIHKRPVYILQWFPYIPLSEAFIVFDGVISSPIEWNEGERTLSFEVLSQIEDLEVGYSAEEGNFEYIPPNLVGKAWPLVFGSVLNLPCVQINESPTGNSLDDIGLDGTGDNQGILSDIADNELRNLTLLEELERECFLMAAILLGNATSLDAQTVGGSAGLTGGGTVDATTGLSGSLSRQSDNPVAQQLYDLGTQYEEKGNEYRAERLRPFNTGLTGTPEQEALDRNQVRVAGGSKFPQKQNLIIRINGVAHEGYFEGDIFHIVSSTSPFADQTAVAGPTQVIDRAVATEYQTDLAVSTFFYSIAGASVTVGGTYPIWYVAGLPFLTNIVVFGKKTTTGNNKYVVPSSYYSVVYKTFGTLQATFIQMHTPLSSRNGENWTDEIWINCTSPIGPNAVDIMQYLITNYTNQSYDTTTFNAVRSLVNPYKCNFALTDRLGSLQVLEDIAYQSRCAIWFKGGRFYLKYLPKKYDPVDSITEDDVESGTMQVVCTDTEDIVTKWSVSWKERLDRDTPNRIVYRYHIRKYGLIEKDYDCYIYNAKASVQKFAQFWLIRKANTWKKIQFSTFLSKLRLEPFDSVLLDFTYPWASDPNCVEPVVGIVEEASYDSNSQRVQLTIWLPIRLGEMCPYDFAYPSDLDTTFIFPQENDPGINTDVPGSGAEGPLYDQSPHTGPGGIPGSTPPFSGFGGDTTPGDSQDEGNAIFDPPVALDPSELVNTGQPPPVQSISQRIIKPLNLDELDVPDATFPGKVVEYRDTSGGRQRYAVDIYLSGLSKPPKRFESIQLVVETEDRIPAGTPCMVSRNCERDENGLVSNMEYTMQVPIWLEPITTTPVAPTELPQSDPGSSEPPLAEVPPQTDGGDQ